MRDRPADRAVATAGEAAALHDRSLLARMLRRDEGALADLYDRHARVLFGLALRIVGDRALAEEVLQDTFLQCWRHAERYDPARGSVAAWLIGVTRNRAIDLLRSRPHRARVRETHFAEPGDVRDPHADGRDEIAALRQVVGTALDRLPHAQREALELAYYGGLTQREIAARQGQPLGTVKTRMRSALERLRQALRPLVDAPGKTRAPPPRAGVPALVRAARTGAAYRWRLPGDPAGRGMGAGAHPGTDEVRAVAITQELAPASPRPTGPHLLDPRGRAHP